MIKIGKRWNEVGPKAKVRPKSTTGGLRGDEAVADARTYPSFLPMRPLLRQVDSRQCDCGARAGASPDRRPSRRARRAAPRGLSSAVTARPAIDRELQGPRARTFGNVNRLSLAEKSQGRHHKRPSGTAIHTADMFLGRDI